MKYILKSLYAIKKDQPIFLILIVISVLVTSIMINFSFGTYRIFKEKRLSEIDELRHLDISIDQNANIAKTSLDQCFLQFSEDLENLTDMVLVNAIIDDQIRLECRFSMRKGEYAPALTFRDNLIKENLTDHYFTLEQEKNGELVALIGIDQKIDRDGKLIIQDKIYEIIGCQSWETNKPMIPFASLDPETEISSKEGIYLNFSRAITRKQYENIKQIFNRNLGELVEIPDFYDEADQNYSLYGILMLISVCIAVVAAINYAVLFQYVMLCQENMLAVYRMCGMKRRQAVSIYLLECLLIIATVYVIGIIPFHGFVLPILGKFSDFIELEFNVKIYLLLFGSYLFSSISILLVVIIVNIYKKSVVDLIRRA